MAITQILLEPYCRTIVGLRDLICKEFVYFGHKFRARTTASVLHPPEHNECSPIFVQFLDAVYQVWRQMPWYRLYVCMYFC